MNKLVTIERICLSGHVLSMVFGLAGLLLVVPNADVILKLSTVGQSVFQSSMTWGGVINILLGAAAVAIYAYRTLGRWHWLTFMLPAVFLSLSSELLGTSTGFPFGHYSYLSGLGYKIAGLVPFTIPISWFYMGLVSYLIACAGLKINERLSWVRQIGAIALGALLFTAWDFALEPAMSQGTVPFWYWEQPGAFFGTPYQNYAGWFGTSALFIGVAALFWKQKPPISLTRAQLSLPLTVYLSNYAYAAALSCGVGFWIPVLLGLLVGVASALTLWWMAQPALVPVTAQASASLNSEVPVKAVKVGVK